MKPDFYLGIGGSDHFMRPGRVGYRNWRQELGSSAITDVARQYDAYKTQKRSLIFLRGFKF